jgi:hypothetical protein
MKANFDFLESLRQRRRDIEINAYSHDADYHNSRCRTWRGMRSGV